MNGNNNLSCVMSLVASFQCNFNLILDMYSQEIKKRIQKRKVYLKRLQNKRKLQMLLLASCSESRIWKVERPTLFWELDCQMRDEQFFKENFRVTKKNFAILCRKLNVLEKRQTNYRDPIPIEKRVAIALYALGSSSEYRSIGNLFSIGKSTVCKIVVEFCHAVWDKLAREYLESFALTREKIMELVAGFDMLGFPQCLGAVDGCHIEVHPSSADATDYYNYKGWYSTILLALVDYRYRFLYINIGCPGRCNDSYLFEKSHLKRYLNNCTLLDEMSKPIGGAQVPVFIIGDSAFRFSKRLMKPYAFSVSNDNTKKKFNFSLSKSRRVVENAFGHLKARFRRIGKGIDNQMKNVNIVVKACCVLHNFLNENNDTITSMWLRAQQIVDDMRQMPSNEHILEYDDLSAEAIRSSIATFLSYVKEPPNPGKA